MGTSFSRGYSALNRLYERYSGSHFGGSYSILAEIGTLQLEYSYLAKVTGQPWHFNRVRSCFTQFLSQLRLNSFRLNQLCESSNLPI